jgi:hypothetical protein
MNALRIFRLKRACHGQHPHSPNDAYKAVRGLVEELRTVKLFDAEANSILWAAEGLLLASSPTDAEAVEARTTFDTLMDGLVAQRWQDVGPTTAELQRKRLVEAFAECAPVETVPASRRRLSHGVETTNAPPAQLEQLLAYHRPAETHGRVCPLEHAAELQARLVELGDEPVRIDVGAEVLARAERAWQQSHED